ncbi:MAG: rhomboid family intramembrane serine protease [Desulfobacter sp.]|nr:rhomboid family intramembrane serine protease [Desulfobacter sp.]WDP86550.1 MAG: rhomboid family intramembrane serine protease [Desulfobacter sp.]
MIPIRDNQESDILPVATYSIMGVTLLVFLWQMILGLDNESVFYVYGFVPGKYTIPELSVHFSNANKLLSPVFYMFFHGGFWHFIGNMWFLYIFGDNIEGHFGSLRFIGFYLACGLFSALFHFMLNFYSPVPTIGASGAIAGVMGAYFLLFPGSRILTLIPVFIFPIFIHIPAFVFLGIWFLLQFFNAAGPEGSSNIAWWAHVGGFITGVVLVKLNQGLPSTGARQRLDKLIRKKHTHKLQVITPGSMDGGPDLYGTLEVTSLEALTGTWKMITIPWGFAKPLYRVKVPSGIKRGTRLKLKGMGKHFQGHPKGDLFLRVEIKNVV